MSYEDSRNEENITAGVSLQRGICLAVALLLVAASAFAQSGEPEVHELSGDELTEERLIELLSDKEPGSRTRGPGPRSLGAPPAEDCARLNDKSRGVTVKSVSEKVSVQLLFPFNSDEITSDTAVKLDKIGRALSSRALVQGCFRLEGHTDSIGTESYNEGLSMRRARSVADYLVEKFDIDRNRLFLAAHGESRPVADNDTEVGRQRNRRVQFDQVRGES